MGRPVFLDHDGGFDDFVALLLLAGYEDVDLLGVCVTPADTLLEAALPATRKVLDLCGRSKVTVAAGRREGQHRFPFRWRTGAYAVNDLPVLNQWTKVEAPLSELAGEEFLIRTVLEAPEPVTLVVTGPLTNLAWALESEPALEGNIEEVVVMGGAFDVAGNVCDPGHDGSAEWNLYWDAPSAKRVWDSGVAIRLVPLDATNEVPLAPEFRRAFGGQYEWPRSAAAGSIWAMAVGWELTKTGLPYYCWDTLTAASVAHPDLCTYDEVQCDIVTTGPSEGRTVATPGGRTVTVARHAAAERFYAHCLEVLRA
ncbi:MAG TPA: nucleoside hydrolase [Acidimicrobiia bacterium]|nr:nucleoside hydrolase [Acidimicrobiia bacterium]